MNKMSKSEVYSWRLATELKAELERAARAEKTSVGSLLERVMLAWLSHRETGENAADQARRRAALMACAGIYKGGGTSATNERVRPSSSA